MAVTIINRDNFEEKVLKADKPVILDLWASWCGPCKMLAPVVEELSEAHPEVLVGKVNVDEEPELADRFGVTAIPMLVLVKNGRSQRRLSATSRDSNWRKHYLVKGLFHFVIYRK